MLQIGAKQVFVLDNFLGSRNRYHAVRPICLNCLKFPHEVNAMDQSGLSIAAVERDTGLTKDTLRVWERRYGFPRPGRDEFGERRYSSEDVHKLRLLKRLMDSGHRPGKIIHEQLDVLMRLSEARGLSNRAPVEGEVGALIELIRNHSIEALRSRLVDLLASLRLAAFVHEVVAPVTRAVGELWARGEIEVYEEHLYTEVLQSILREAIGALVPDSAGPSVLLTTFPQEPHGIGLLMVESLLRLEGCRTVSLGVQTPLRDIALAVEAQRADVVALSFSPIAPAKSILEGLVEMRQLLPARVGIWAGGSHPVLARRSVAGVRMLTTLEDAVTAVHDWRAAPRSTSV